MGQLLLGCATTTDASRRAIQHSQESLKGLSKRYGTNPKAVAKWKKRNFVADLPTEPREPQVRVLGNPRQKLFALRRNRVASSAANPIRRRAAVPPFLLRSLQTLAMRKGPRFKLSCVSGS
jgi:hypothetical protein